MCGRELTSLPSMWSTTCRPCLASLFLGSGLTSGYVLSVTVFGGHGDTTVSHFPFRWGGKRVAREVLQKSLCVCVGEGLFLVPWSECRNSVSLGCCPLPPLRLTMVDLWQTTSPFGHERCCPSPESQKGAMSLCPGAVCGF